MMVRSRSGAEVIYDTSHAYAHRSRSGPSASERRNFMSPNLADMYMKASPPGSANNLNSEDEEMDMRKILKDIEFLGSSNMSWKERKQLENQKVVALGGKPPKRRRLPLSVAKAPMKRQKLREEKKLHEDMLLGRVHKKRAHERSEKRKPEDSVLMTTGGYFKKGVLNVKHMLGPSRPKSDVHVSIGNRKKTGKGKNKGKKKKKKKKKRH